MLFAPETFRRRLLILALVGVLPAFGAPALAAGTGQISGNVTDARTGAAVAGAVVDAVSPSDRYHTSTDAHGTFALAGVAVDTYTISVQRPGYDIFALQGATVTQDETFRVTVKLTNRLQTIASVRSRARSIASAYQPDQTVDRTVVTSAGIDQLLGKSFNTNGQELLSELPGVAIDKNGTVLIRGGTSFEGALEFEGIDYTEPNRSLSDRFENVGSNYLLNGVGSLEIIPGGGDATHGNTGTGLVSLTAKRGTYPMHGTLDYELGWVGAGPQAGFEYGAATSNNRISNYVSYISSDAFFQYGPYGIDPASQISDPTSINPELQAQFTANQRSLYTTAVFNKAYQQSRDFLDNAVFKFGRNSSQQLQFFVQTQQLHQDLDYGGSSILTAVPQTIYFGPPTSQIGNPLFNPTGSAINALQNLTGYSGGNSTYTNPANPLSTLSQTAVNFLRRFVPAPYGATPGAALTHPETIDSPFSAYKFEYDNNLSATANIGLRAYRTDNAATEVLPSQGLYVPQDGGIRRGLATDITKVLSDKNTLRIGGKYEFVEPFGSRVDSIDYTGAFEGTYAQSGGQVFNLGPYTHDILADFLQPSPTLVVSPSNPNTLLAGTPGCIGSPNPGLTAAPQEHCGYLYKYFPSGVPALPAETEIPTANEQVYGLYAQDTYSPNGRLHVLAGLRLDGYNFLLPNDPGNPPAIEAVRHQRLYQPKLGVSYRVTNRDAVRANFGRSLSIPLPAFLGQDISRASLAPFNRIPSFDSVTGKPATYCGPASPHTVFGSPYVYGKQSCSSYGDQLYWLLRDARYSTQSQINYPLRGATFTNYDFTYSHEFPGGDAVKITPFYRRGYDVVETSQTLLGIDPNFGTQLLSPEIESNLGLQRATGFEFEATTPQLASGLSATITATYVNQIGNDPPGDYLPTASVLLGELYRSPNIAPFQATLAATYKSKWGLRINPIFTFKSGYPYGNGVYQALTVNGQSYYIPYTDAVYQGIYSGLLANAQVNPQYPGTIANPNIFATRGTEGRTSGPGQLYSPAFLNLDLTASYTRLVGKSALTYGLAVTNLFDRVAGVPSANYTQDCQVIYTGLCATTGLPSISDPYHHSPKTANSSTAPYIIFTNQQPLQLRLFLQATL